MSIRQETGIHPLLGRGPRGGLEARTRNKGDLAGTKTMKARQKEPGHVERSPASGRSRDICFSGDHHSHGGWEAQHA